MRVQRQLQKLTWKHVRNLVPDKIDTVLFPVGTVEAHAAAALGTDNFIPESIADYLAGKINALVAPLLAYGITKSLYGYPGSMTVTPRSFENIVKDILKSFHDIGFKKIFVINGHGGNNDVLKNVAYEFFYQFRTRIAVIQWWELCADLTREFFGQEGGHGAIDETAMVQAMDESLVDSSLYDNDMAYFFRRGASVYPVPGSMLLYKDGEGLPDFDAARARQYQQKVFAEMESFVKMILSRWEKI
jgi:creatinine amidohydrolase